MTTYRAIPPIWGNLPGVLRAPIASVFLVSLRNSDTYSKPSENLTFSIMVWKHHGFISTFNYFTVFEWKRNKSLQNPFHVAHFGNPPQADKVFFCPVPPYLTRQIWQNLNLIIFYSISNSVLVFHVIQYTLCIFYYMFMFSTCIIPAIWNLYVL